MSLDKLLLLLQQSTAGHACIASGLRQRVCPAGTQPTLLDFQHYVEPISSAPHLLSPCVCADARPQVVVPALPASMYHGTRPQHRIFSSCCNNVISWLSLQGICRHILNTPCKTPPALLADAAQAIWLAHLSVEAARYLAPCALTMRLDQPATHMCVMFMSCQMHIKVHDASSCAECTRKATKRH